MQLLIATGGLEEVKPTISRLQLVGKTLKAINVFTDNTDGCLLLPGVFSLEQLSQIMNDLHEVYEVGTLRVQEMRRQAVPPSWERGAQVELDEFRDLAAVLATFCNAAATILRLQGPIPRTQYTHSINATLDDVLQALDYTFAAGMKYVMEKGGDTLTVAERQKLNKKLAEALDRLEQLIPRERAVARLYERRRTLRHFLNPAVCLTPVDSPSFCKNILQGLDKKWHRISSIADDDRMRQEITFSRCSLYPLYLPTLALPA